MDFVEICNIYVGKMITKAAKRILHSDKICHSYNDLNFSITFFGILQNQCFIYLYIHVLAKKVCVNIFHDSCIAETKVRHEKCRWQQGL